jgi:hypothetical protein
MPPPYEFQSNWEDGTLSPWSTETDTESKLNIRHYTQLYASPVREMPWRGAFAPHIDLSLGTADAYFEVAQTIAAAAVRYVRFYLYAQGLTMAASDRFTIFTLQSAGPVSEVVIDIRNNAGVIEILAAETGAAATVRAAELIQNQWHAVELRADIDAGGGNDGTLDFYLDGRQVSTQITTLDQAAITQMRLGAIGIDAGTTAGHLLFDEFVLDDARIYPFDGRYSIPRELTQSSHVVVGPGQVEDVFLRDGGSADCTLTLYDTDIADLSAGLVITPLDFTAGYRFGDPWLSGGTFKRGCYAVLAGTNPRAFIGLRNGAQSKSGVENVAAFRR